MTLPQTGSFSLIDVRDKCLQDTGSIQLTSNRTRDFYRTKTGDVALSSCRAFAWSAGRTQINQSPSSAVRPFHAAYGVDGGGSKTRSVKTSGDRVTWEPRVYGTSSVAGASYMSSFFYAQPGHDDFELKYTYSKISGATGGGTIRLQVQVIGFFSGFLEGASSALIPIQYETLNSASRTHNFTVPNNRRYVLFSIGAWMSGGTSQNSQWGVTNMQVNHR